MKIYPVVHITTPEIAAHSGLAALDRGADGVYLIDHEETGTDRVYDTFNRITERRPEAFVGVNLLDIQPFFAVKSLYYAAKDGKISREPDALWTDDIIDGINGRRTGEAKRYRDAQDMRTRILGGVAFKYTDTYTDDPSQAARLTRSLQYAVDVVTTSGEGTGHAPSPEKIRAMKRAATGELAVASGIDAYNVDEYRGSVYDILVATSIETEPYSGVFDMRKLDDLLTAVHAQYAA